MDVDPRYKPHPAGLPRTQTLSPPLHFKIDAESFHGPNLSPSSPTTNSLRFARSATDLRSPPPYERPGTAGYEEKQQRRQQQQHLESTPAGLIPGPARLQRLNTTTTTTTALLYEERSSPVDVVSRFERPTTGYGEKRRSPREMVPASVRVERPTTGYGEKGRSHGEMVPVSVRVERPTAGYGQKGRSHGEMVPASAKVERPTTGYGERKGRSPVDAMPPPPRYVTPSPAGFEGRTRVQTDLAVEIPSPRALSPATTTASPTSSLTPDIRRVKSSSALSASLDEQESVASPKTETSAASKFKTAWGEAQYFAGGLLAHPAESTRHYSIIRHSRALVWYSGPTTTVSVTILSDEPVPLDRTMWLQQKGYSGNMGMSLKAMMGTKDSWIDVTPATRAGSEHLPDVEERSIQRDLKRFAKKASGRLKKHAARETHVIRIPASAVDGYFRLVLCSGQGGKKTLCGSPVFRVASTTTEISVVRGASMKTMPLEVGVKVASTVGQQVAKKYAGVAALAVQNKATAAVTKGVSNAAVSRVKKVAESGKKAAEKGRQVAEKTGMDTAVTDSWERGKNGRYDAKVFETTTSLVGPDEGPEAPFPVSFEGKVARASGQSMRELGIPTANVREVRDQVKMRMRGVFAAWANVVPNKGTSDEVDTDWHEAIVTIGPLRYAPPEVVMKNRVAVHILHDFDGADFVDARLRVIVMGYLHPPLEREASEEVVMAQHEQDSMAVLASLGRTNWTVEQASRRDRTLTDRLDGVTGTVQGRVDRIPLHWVGVRSESGAMRDKLYGIGGLWIPR